MEYPDDVIRDVADRALREWDLGAAKVALISRSENVVFRVDAEDGRAYALRVHRPGYHTLAELESEPVWTAALNEAGVGAPMAEPARTGGHYAVVAVPDTFRIVASMESRATFRLIEPMFTIRGSFDMRSKKRAMSWYLPSNSIAIGTSA